MRVAPRSLPTRCMVHIGECVFVGARVMGTLTPLEGAASARDLAQTLDCGDDRDGRCQDTISHNHAHTQHAERPHQDLQEAALRAEKLGISFCAAARWPDQG